MASIANIASPFLSFAPSFTKILDIVPGIGVIAFNDPPYSALASFLKSDSNLKPVESPLLSNK